MTPQKWVSADGRETFVRDMADRHIINAIRKYRNCMLRVLRQLAREAAPRGCRKQIPVIDAATVDMNLSIVVPPFPKLLREAEKRKLLVTP